MKKATEIISKSTKFPTEVISSTPKIEITGNNSLYIENHQGVKILTPEEIVIKLKTGFLIAQGKKISISEINKDFIFLTGIFNSFRFEENLEWFILANYGNLFKVML